MKRKESLLSAPSGTPIESVYNVRNKKADGKYAGKNSHLGSERMNDVLEDFDIISRKKRYTNYLRRGEGQKNMVGALIKKLARELRRMKELILIQGMTCMIMTNKKLIL